MKDLLLRLRAALSPQILFAIAALLMMAAGISMKEGNPASALEKRMENTLSRIEGAGQVSVVIKTMTLQSGGTLSAGRAQEIPCGAVAVAQGADDPLVRLALEEALCALLGLPASAVSVAAGGG